MDREAVTLLLKVVTFLKPANHGRELSLTTFLREHPHITREEGDAIFKTHAKKGGSGKFSIKEWHRMCDDYGVSFNLEMTAFRKPCEER